MRLGIHRDLSGGAVDLRHDVLRHGRPRPQELAGLAIERVDDAGLAGNAGEHLPFLARLESRIDPRHLFRVRRHDGIDDEALERMIEIPVIDDVLVVPDDLAGVGIQRQRGVVVQVLLVVAAEQELRRGRADRRADVDQVQLGIVARHHPRADVIAPLEGHVAPRLVARFARRRDRARAPQLLAGARVVRGDHAGVRAAFGLAAAAGDDLAVGDDRPRALLRALAGSRGSSSPTRACRSARRARRRSRRRSCR